MTDLTGCGYIVKARIPKFEEFTYDFSRTALVEAFVKECVSLGWPEAKIVMKLIEEIESELIDGDKTWVWECLVNGFKVEVKFKGTPKHASCFFTTSEPVKAHPDDDAIEDAQCGVSIHDNKKIIWTWNSQKSYIETLFETIKGHVARSRRRR